MYADLEYAESYFETRLHSEMWGEKSPSDRTKSLHQATRSIDALNFVGCRTVSTQANEFPRGGDTVVPEDIKIACCEIAYALLDGRLPDEDLEDLAVTSRGFSSVRTSTNRDFAQEHINAGVPSATAWRHLLPYLRDGRGVKLSRVD